LLAQTGTGSAEIDLIVLASVTPDRFSLPLPAWVRTHWAQKGPGVRPFRRVLGFAYALTVGAQFVGSGVHRKVMVIGSDAMSKILDYKDRATWSCSVTARVLPCWNLREMGRYP